MALLLLTASHAGIGQSCGGGTITITPGTSTVPGITPDSLPCILNGSNVTDTLYLTNYSTYHSLPINYVTIDSIENLPGGLCWELADSIGTTLTAGQDAVIYIQGLCAATPGQYKLRIIVDVGAGPNNALSVQKEDAESVFGLRYYLRVNCPGGACPGIDTTEGRTMAFIPDTLQACSPGLGIHEIGEGISGISITPNPFAGSAVVSFDAQIEGTHSLRLTDLMGVVVSTASVQAVDRHNQLTLPVYGISPGMYLLSVSDGHSIATYKVVIE